MNRERWLRVKGILAPLLELPEHERAKALDAACGGDLALKAEVASLLAREGALLELDVASLDATDLDGTQSVPSGTRLGPYEVLELIGAGGMGEVYRSRDTRLGREVAVKVVGRARLDEHRRLEREARAAGTLNHPNILTLFDVGFEGDTQFVVTELLQGRTLRAHLADGAPDYPTALGWISQIAAGLEAAHARGVIHRDLKPENLFVTSTGLVKILDFGLAKQLEPAHSSAASGRTAPGAILGTVGYMAPEQVRGLAADARSDVFAFGAVVYELLTGQRAFRGDTPADTAGAILRDKPPRASMLRAGLPPAVDELVERCLAKQPEERPASGAELRAAVATLQSGDGAPPAAPRVASARAVRALPALAVTAAAALAAYASFTALRREPPPAARPLRHLTIPNVGSLPGYLAALSPDGRHIVYTEVGEPFGQQPLYVRALSDVVPRELPGTRGARNPFFSPDGEWIAFFRGRHLWRTELCSGPRQVCGSPQQICETDDYPDGTGFWAGDGTILISRALVGGRPWPGLARVRLDSRTAEALTTVDVARGERFHSQPEVLPESGSVLFTVTTRRGFRIDAVARDGTRRRVLVDDASAPRYAASGHLLSYHPGSRAVRAAAFDARAARLVGAPVTVLDDVMRGVSGAAGYAIARDGTLIYNDSKIEALDWHRAVVRVARNGAVKPLLGEPAPWSQPRFSPDGRRLLVRKLGTPNCDLWIYEFGRDVLTRLTNDTDAHDPAWHPGGQQIALSAGRAGGSYGIQSRAVFEGDAPGLLTSGGEDRRSPAWSQDGRRLAFTIASAATGLDVWIADPAAQAEERQFLGADFNEDQAVFSPDGGRVAYTSDETGRDEVYVRRYPDGGAKLQVSSEGGTDPLWSRTGDELYFVAGDRMRMMAAKVGSAGIGKAQLVFRADFIKTRELRNYDLSPSGRDFAVVTRAPGAAVAQQLHVVFDWSEELRRRAPTR